MYRFLRLSLSLAAAFVLPVTYGAEEPESQNPPFDSAAFSERIQNAENEEERQRLIREYREARDAHYDAAVSEALSGTAPSVDDEEAKRRAREIDEDMETNRQFVNELVRLPVEERRKMHREVAAVPHRERREKQREILARLRDQKEEPPESFIDQWEFRSDQAVFA